MSLQMRLLVVWHVVAVLLCLQGEARESESCPRKQGTTPILTSAEPGSYRGLALLSVQWRRSLVADDEATENSTPDSLATTMGELNLPSNMSIDAAAGLLVAGSVGTPVAAELSMGTPVGTELSLQGNASFDVSEVKASSMQALLNTSGVSASNLSRPVVVMDGSENSTDGDRDKWHASRSSVNSSGHPTGKEQFEPFGYPGNGLLLELHMPQVTLRELHSSSHGSLASFLLELRNELSKAADVDEPRISVLGIFGRFKRVDGDGLLRIATESVGSQAAQTGSPVSSHVDEEVIVRFEVLPGYGNDADPREVLEILRSDLNRQQSGLLQGPLSSKLDNATLTMSAPVGIGAVPRTQEHRGMAHMSAMAWPIGISAAFIGVLIWLAAY